MTESNLAPKHSGFIRVLSVIVPLRKAAHFRPWAWRATNVPRYPPVSAAGRRTYLTPAECSKSPARTGLNRPRMQASERHGRE